MDVDAAVAVERADPAVLLEPVGLGGQLDEADRLEARRLPGLGLEPRVQIAGVLAHLGRRLRQRTERDHQTGGVPRGARRQLVALQHDDVGAAHVGEVIRDRAADHSPADHHDSGTLRQDGGMEAECIHVATSPECIAPSPTALPER